MIAIKSSEDKLWGCPNCGCSTWTRDSIFVSNQPTGVCRHCGLRYQILADELNKPDIKVGTGRKDKNNEEIMETPRLISHPRVGMHCWKYEVPDERPDGDGEFWRPRGIGYDLAGFVRTKQAGERIHSMVQKVLETDVPKSWLDYREQEPEWIQYKFQPSEFNLEKLYKLTKDKKIITEEILYKCKLDGRKN